MKHLYALYSIEQSTTTPYNPCGNAQCEWFNCAMMGLLVSLSKEQKDNWPLHLPSLVFAYNAMPHSTTGYQPYELMFGHKAPTICNAWLRLADYDDNYFQSKCEWVNQQHELILAANRHALKRIKQSVEKSVSWPGGKDLKILIGNLVLLYDHPEGQNKLQDHYKSKLFVMEWKHQDPNVLCIQWTDNSYLTFRSHWRTICYIQPLIPTCLLCWCRNHKIPRLPNQIIHMVPGQKPKWILPY